MFISLDGIDGGGKSTQIELLAQWLRQRGRRVELFRDPGSTPLGESVREILLHRHEIALEPTAEMLLYMACRAQLVAEQIQPALSRGAIVISDRYLLANVVYQGYGGGLDVESLWRVGAIATGGLMPDLTIVLDLPVDIARQRIGVQQDRLEQRGAAYYQRVRDGFLREAERGGKRSAVIDATASPEMVAAQIQRVVEAALSEVNV